MPDKSRFILALAPWVRNSDRVLWGGSSAPRALDKGHVVALVGGLGCRVPWGGPHDWPLGQDDGQAGLCWDRRPEGLCTAWTAR